MKGMIALLFVLALLAGCSAQSAAPDTASGVTASSLQEPPPPSASQVEETQRTQGTSVPADESGTLAPHASVKEPGNVSSHAEKDGLRLTVTRPLYVPAGEGFVLTAVIENKRSTPVTAALPTGTPNMHYEIRVTIGSGKNSCTDADTIGLPMNEMMSFMTLQPGESYTQTMHMLPGSFEPGTYPTTRNIQSGTVAPLEPKDGKFIAMPAGKWEGRAEFVWFSGSSADYDGSTSTSSLELKFPLTIV